MIIKTATIESNHAGRKKVQQKDKQQEHNCKYHVHLTCQACTIILFAAFVVGLARPCTVLKKEENTTRGLGVQPPHPAQHGRGWICWTYMAARTTERGWWSADSHLHRKLFCYLLHVDRICQASRLRSLHSSSGSGGCIPRLAKHIRYGKSANPSSNVRLKKGHWSCGKFTGRTGGSQPAPNPKS